jgi:hypothetical protein
MGLRPARGVAGSPDAITCSMLTPVDWPARVVAHNMPSLAQPEVRARDRRLPFLENVTAGLAKATVRLLQFVLALDLNTEVVEPLADAPAPKWQSSREGLQASTWRSRTSPRAAALRKK